MTELGTLYSAVMVMVKNKMKQKQGEDMGKPEGKVTLWPTFSTTVLDICNGRLTVSLHRRDAEDLEGLPGGDTPGKVWGT